MSESRSNLLLFPLNKVKQREENAPRSDLPPSPALPRPESPESRARFDAFCDREFPKPPIDARVARMMALFAGKA